MARTVTPERMDDRKGFEVNRAKSKKGFPKDKGRVDDEVESY